VRWITDEHASPGASGYDISLRKLSQSSTTTPPQLAGAASRGMPRQNTKAISRMIRMIRRIVPTPMYMGLLS
jgi:hypothetical protein